MVRIMVAPGKYIQAPRILEKAGEYIAPLGSRVFLVSDPLAWPLVEKQICTSFDGKSIEYQCELFSGTSNRAEADVLSEKARAFRADVVVGVGGGSALDLAKAVFAQIDSKLATIPTVASNDSPCSALAVMYDKNHRLDVVLRLKRNPDLVLVDSKVIAEAPTRFFVAGMGDALATWFEALACAKSGATNSHAGLPTTAGLGLARTCYDTLMQYGISAKLAVDRNTVTPAVERVIEANILLSGLGFENGGVAAATGWRSACARCRGPEGPCTGKWWRSDALPSSSWKTTRRPTSTGSSSSASPWGCP